MSYTEKIDVLDLLIEILQDHEKKIDELVARLEASAEVLCPEGQCLEDRLLHGAAEDHPDQDDLGL